MEEASIWLTNAQAIGLELISDLIAALPGFAGAVFLLVVGWLIARGLRAASLRLSNWFNRLLETIVPTGRLAKFRLSGRAAKLVGNTVYWLTIFFAITLAADVAHFDTLSSWMSVILGYLPQIFGGTFIVVVGYLIGVAIRDVVSTTLSSMGMEQGELTGLAAQWLVFLTAAIVGIEQIGIDVSFLIVIVAIAMGSVMGGMAIAFGLGARPLAANLIGAHYLQQQYAAGQTLAIGDLQGQILEFTATGVVIETSEGRSTVPGDTYFHSQITLKNGDQNDD